MLVLMFPEYRHVITYGLLALFSIIITVSIYRYLCCKLFLHDKLYISQIVYLVVTHVGLFVANFGLQNWKGETKEILNYVRIPYFLRIPYYIRIPYYKEE